MTKEINLSGFEKRFPILTGNSCGILNRDRVIDRYLCGEMDENEMGDYDEHVLYCTECYKDIQLANSVHKAFEENHPMVQTSPRWSGSRIIKYSTAAIVLITASYFSLFFMSQASTSPLHKIASVEQFEHDLTSVKRSEGKLSSKENIYNKGLLFLKDAEQTRFLEFFPTYNLEKVKKSIENLTQVYEDSTFRKSERETAAFFLAKAFLMKKDINGALIWIEKRKTINSNFYERPSAKLKKEIQLLSGS